MADPPEITFATGDAMREDIYRFRYRIYVEEMGRYRSVADHDGRRLIEPDDDVSHLVAAVVDGKTVGTARFTWGGDQPLNDRVVKQYDLARIRQTVPDDRIVVGERFMVAPEYRGTDLLYRIFCFYMEFINTRRIQLAFGDCEPHLLNVYQGLGYRTYTDRNVNSPQTGYLVPLVLVPEDLDYLRRVRSPLADVLTDFGAGSRVPSDLDKLLSGGIAVVSQKLLDNAHYWQRFDQALRTFSDHRHHIFAGMSKTEIEHCLDKSNVIRCAKGDRLIKKDNVARNMFVVLAGVLEVRDADKVVAVLSAGEMFGEIAFFLKLPRTRDVYAASDDVEILSLSDSTLRQLIASHSETAAKLLKNVSTILCQRIASAG